MFSGEKIFIYSFASLMMFLVLGYFLSHNYSLDAYSFVELIVALVLLFKDKLANIPFLREKRRKLFGRKYSKLFNTGETGSEGESDISLEAKKDLITTMNRKLISCPELCLKFIGSGPDQEKQKVEFFNVLDMLNSTLYLLHGKAEGMNYHEFVENYSTWLHRELLGTKAGELIMEKGLLGDNSEEISKLETNIEPKAG